MTFAGRPLGRLWTVLGFDVAEASVAVPKDLEVLSPWQIISDSTNAEHLVRELSSELSPQHPLHGLKTTAVAKRIDRDDVLFAVDGGSAALAVVHLTWRMESDPRWPITRLFASWEDWVHNEMLPAHEEYSC
jgi:hypothetical protein